MYEDLKIVDWRHARDGWVHSCFGAFECVSAIGRLTGGILCNCLNRQRALIPIATMDGISSPCDAVHFILAPKSHLS